MSAAPARYVVTGASGWVGQAVLHVLKRRLGRGWARKVTLFGASERLLAAPDGALVAQRALASLTPADVEGAGVVHLSFLGREKGDAMDEARFRAANHAIDDGLAQALRRAPPAALFVASSGAARLAEEERDDHPYGRAKLAQEALFSSLAEATGTPTCIGRIYTLAGPYMNKLGSYALSSFLLQARGTGRIRIEARRPVYRAYLHVLDLAELVLTSLKDGQGWAGPRDLCGMTTVEMQDVALAAARAAGLPPSAIERGPLELEPPGVYLGDPVQTRTLALAGGLHLRSFDVQVRDTAGWIARTPGAPAG